MQIFVDADACPVVDIVETIAEKYNIPTEGVKNLVSLDRESF